MRIWIFLFALCIVSSGCDGISPKPKIGVSMGVGGATRWVKEKGFMEERAKELGVELEVRINTDEQAKTQLQDCIELVDSGIDVLVLTPRDVRKSDAIIAYAKQKNVKVISYARALMGESIDLFVGYDIYKIGQSLGRHLVEKVYQGNFIVLKGDEHDFNSLLLYYGGMKFIEPLVKSGNIKILGDEFVVGWSIENAKKLVKDIIIANNYIVDAIFAPNDKIAGACVSVLKELEINRPVVITGMDTELVAIKRLVAGTQDVTIFLDFKALARTAINEAYNMATKKKLNINSEIDNESHAKIAAYLVNGQIVTKENIDKLLIEPGHYTREQVYGQ